METWRHLVQFHAADLARLDIAWVNLVCAAGLPGAENLDIDLCLGFVDDCAEQVRRHLPRARQAFEANPAHWDDSWSICRIHMLMCVVHKKGVHYNRATIPEDAPFQTADAFLFGIVQGDGGTCASLPAFYAAVGRRLGWPIKIATTRTPKYGHAFARWEEPGGERFNIEINDRSLDCPPDDKYRTGQYSLTPELEREGCFLVSLNATQELAHWLTDRGFAWLHHGIHRQAVDAFAWASSLTPENKCLFRRLRKTMSDWDAALQARRPAPFPEVHIRYRQRRFPASLPLETEREIYGLEATENALKHPDCERLWWQPMRAGSIPSGIPKRADVEIDDYRCDLRLRFA